MRLLFLLFIMALVSTGCEKHKPVDELLIGKWIRLNHNSDTIIFRDYNFFELRRGVYYDSVNKTNKPLTPFGLYSYDCTDSSIYIQSLASSYIPPEPIPRYFKLSDRRFEIANFIDSTESVMLFEKIE